VLPGRPAAAARRPPPAARPPCAATAGRLGPDGTSWVPMKVHGLILWRPDYVGSAGFFRALTYEESMAASYKFYGIRNVHMSPSSLSCLQHRCDPTGPLGQSAQTDYTNILVWQLERSSMLFNSSLRFQGLRQVWGGRSPPSYPTEGNVGGGRSPPATKVFTGMFRVTAYGKQKLKTNPRTVRLR